LSNARTNGSPFFQRVPSSKMTSVTSIFSILGLVAVPATLSTQLLNESLLPPSTSILPSMRIPGPNEPDRSRTASRIGRSKESSNSKLTRTREAALFETLRKFTHSRMVPSLLNHVDVRVSRIGLLPLRFRHGTVLSNSALATLGASRSTQRPKAKNVRIPAVF
jgi:hypothetical protein